MRMPVRVATRGHHKPLSHTQHNSAHANSHKQNLSAAMQAAVIDRPGGVEVFKLAHDHHKPTRGPGQVLVRIVSSSVNPVDTKLRVGGTPRYAGTKFPKVLGGDLAGYVEEADERSHFKKNDAVAALTPGFWTGSDSQDGTYCQYAAVDEAQLALLPQGVDIATAGGVPLVALTAWQALMAAQPHKGQRALVLAASGGVGHMAVQLAKSLGLYVVGVAGPSNVSWVQQELGADEVVDYSKQDYSEVFKDNKFDLAIDCLPGQVNKLAPVLKPCGHLSHIMNNASDKADIQGLQQQHEQQQQDGGVEGASASITLAQPNGAQLAEVFELIAAGKVKLEVAKVFPLSEVGEAHKHVESGHTRGKVVLQIP